jgi:hypothetical protein
MYWYTYHTAQDHDLYCYYFMVNYRDNKLVLVPTKPPGFWSLLKWLRHVPTAEVYKTWSYACKHPHGIS